MAINKKLGPVDNGKSPVSQLRTLPYGTVEIDGGFWAYYQQLNRSVSIPHGFHMLQEAGNLSNFRIAAGLEERQYYGYRFADSDVYKWLEAVAWELGRAADESIQRMADEAIDLVQKAQQADGYLNSYYQITAPDKRWTDLDHGHELYCAGHLIQAAIAFHRALADERLMEITLSFVDLIYDTFAASKGDETCGHPEIEMALVELYRVTGDRRHLDLAQIFIDRRGKNKMRGHAGYGPVYQQDHVPIRDATEVAGHAVRQVYLTTGVTDLYMERGEDALMEAMLTLWADMTQRKMAVTGGIGSRFDGEAFGGPYELPADTCYNETCAAIASLMWNWRLLLITGQSRYADLFERALYNGALSSPGQDGASYLYVNPLHVRDGRYVRALDGSGTGAERMRPAWHSCACCPPNVMRTFSSLSHYMVTANDTGLQIHQYASANLAADLWGEPLKIDMETQYPWDGQITLSLRESPQSPWSLSLRVPGWCRHYTLSLNGNEIKQAQDASGYLVIERNWQAGDVLQLQFQMEPVFITPNPRIDALRSCAAVERGPLVYCLESHDQPANVDLLDVQAITSAPLEIETADLWGGVVSITVPGRIPVRGWGNSLYMETDERKLTEASPVQLRAIPYFLWGNRGINSMRVWIPTTTEEAS